MHDQSLHWLCILGTNPVINVRLRFTNLLSSFSGFLAAHMSKTVELFQDCKQQGAPNPRLICVSILNTKWFTNSSASWLQHNQFLYLQKKIIQRWLTMVTPGDLQGQPSTPVSLDRDLCYVSRPLATFSWSRPHISSIRYIYSQWKYKCFSYTKQLAYRLLHSVCWHYPQTESTKYIKDFPLWIVGNISIWPHNYLIIGNWHSC